MHRIKDLTINNNVVSIIRNPLDCVPSWTAFNPEKRDGMEERNLEWYIAYCKTYKENLGKILVLSFEQLISNPIKCLDKISNQYGYEPPLFSTKEDLDKQFDNDSNFIGRTPDDIRETFASIKEITMSSPSFNQANELFMEINEQVKIQ